MTTNGSGNGNALDGFAAVQAFNAEEQMVGGALTLMNDVKTRMRKIQWERDLAEHGYERNRMSPELSEALRNEIRKALENDGKPFDIVVARRVYDLAMAAKDMCAAAVATANVQQAIDAIADNGGPMESLVSPGTPESGAQAAESFGARMFRELLAIVKPQRAPEAVEDPLALVNALAEARRSGMTDVAAELEQRLLGKKLDGERPIAPVIDVPEGSFEHGFADGKAGASPVYTTEASEYQRGYKEGTMQRFLAPVEPVPAKPHVALNAKPRKLDDGPQCAKKGTCQCFDGCGSCDGCGRWLGVEEDDDEAPTVPHDPPLCAACVKDPDPRGGSACHDCRELAAHRGDRIEHPFQPRKTDHFTGPVGETCEYCGKDPRNTIHTKQLALDDYQKQSTGGLSLDEAERLYKENLGY